MSIGLCCPSAKVLLLTLRRHLPRADPRRLNAGMQAIGTEDPLAVAVVEAIQTGDLPALRRLLQENPGLATARLGDDDPDGVSRTLLHVATDWPGHFPNGAATVAAIVEAGADVNARFHGLRGSETARSRIPR